MQETKKGEKKIEERSKKGLTKGGKRAIICFANRKGAHRFPGREREDAGVAKQVDARDLKSRDTKVSYRFEPGVRHLLLIN